MQKSDHPVRKFNKANFKEDLLSQYLDIAKQSGFKPGGGSFQLKGKGRQSHIEYGKWTRLGSIYGMIEDNTEFQKGEKFSKKSIFLYCRRIANFFAEKHGFRCDENGPESASSKWKEEVLGDYGQWLALLDVMDRIGKYTAKPNADRSNGMTP